MDLSKIRAGFFDVDGTLYPYTEAFLKSLRAEQAKVLVDLVQGRIDLQEALRICLESYQKHGNSYTTPAEQFGFCPRRLHEEFHASHSVDHIETQPELKEAFRRAAGQGIQMVALTHSHMNFAARALSKLEITDFFSMILSLERANFLAKHVDPHMFEAALAFARIAPEEAMMAEDTLANLEMAHRLGIHTAYIHWGTPLDTLPSYVDVQYETPVFLLDALTAAKQLRPIKKSILQPA